MLNKQEKGFQIFIGIDWAWKESTCYISWDFKGLYSTSSYIENLAKYIFASSFTRANS